MRRDIGGINYWIVAKMVCSKFSSPENESSTLNICLSLKKRWNMLTGFWYLRLKKEIKNGMEKLGGG